LTELVSRCRNAGAQFNLTGFFGYLPLFWLGALRDAGDEFTPRSGHWGRLLKSVRIPDELEADALRILAELDARIVAADPRLNAIADQIGQATRVAGGRNPRVFWRRWGYLYNLWFGRSRVRRSAERRSDETRDTGVSGDIEPIVRYMQLEGESK